MTQHTDRPFSQFREGWVRNSNITSLSWWIPHPEYGRRIPVLHHSRITIGPTGEKSICKSGAVQLPESLITHYPPLIETDQLLGGDRFDTILICFVRRWTECNSWLKSLMCRCLSDGISSVAKLQSEGICGKTEQVVHEYSASIFIRRRRLELISN